MTRSCSGQDEIAWEGLLRDIRLHFSLDRNEAEEPRLVDEVVGRFEIDWIELTGPEERSQGELAPPPVNASGMPKTDFGLYSPAMWMAMAKTRL